MGSISAKKSFKEGHVAVRVKLTARGWQSDSIVAEGSTDLTTDEARNLAAALMAAADRADAKVAAKAASDERRKKWRDREIAAGRLKIIGMNEVFGPR